MNQSYQVLNEIVVDHSALTHNFNYFAKAHPESSIAPVIKANAYGHGLILVADWIKRSLPSIPFVCVDSLYEAYELTKGGIKLDCLIMGYTNPANYQINKRLPYIFGVSDLASLNSLGQYQPHARIHLKFNTGMSRLGLEPTELPEILRLLKRYPKLKLEGAYSHLASAQDPAQSSFTHQQCSRLKSIITMLENAGHILRYRHISATAGSEVIHDPYFNLIRLGLGFYGYSPFGPRTTAGLRQRKYLRPALTLTTHIAHLTTLCSGDTVGYDRTYRAKQQECVATLPLGYHEGVSRMLSNCGFVTIGNTVCPIVGRVSMNMTTIKIPRTHHLVLNHPVTVINPTPNSPNSIYSLAKMCHTTPYTILTALQSSIKRSIL